MGAFAFLLGTCTLYTELVTIKYAENMHSFVGRSQTNPKDLDLEIHARLLCCEDRDL